MHLCTIFSQCDVPLTTRAVISTHLHRHEHKSTFWKLLTFPRFSAHFFFHCPFWSVHSCSFLTQWANAMSDHVRALRLAEGHFNMKHGCCSRGQSWDSSAAGWSLWTLRHRAILFLDSSVFSVLGVSLSCKPTKWSWITVIHARFKQCEESAAVILCLMWFMLSLLSHDLTADPETLDWVLRPQPHIFPATLDSLKSCQSTEPRWKWTSGFCYRSNFSRQGCQKNKTIYHLFNQPNLFPQAQDHCGLNVTSLTDWGLVSGFQLQHDAKEKLPLPDFVKLLASAVKYMFISQHGW